MEGSTPFGESMNKFIKFCAEWLSFEGCLEQLRHNIPNGPKSPRIAQKAQKAEKAQNGPNGQMAQLAKSGPNDPK